jgi:hypothetical protein
MSVSEICVATFVGGDVFARFRNLIHFEGMKESGHTNASRTQYAFRLYAPEASGCYAKHMLLDHACTPTTISPIVTIPGIIAPSTCHTAFTAPFTILWVACMRSLAAHTRAVYRRGANLDG